MPIIKPRVVARGKKSALKPGVRKRYKPGELRLRRKFKTTAEIEATQLFKKGRKLGTEIAQREKRYKVENARMQNKLDRIYRELLNTHAIINKKGKSSSEISKLYERIKTLEAQMKAETKRSEHMRIEQSKQLSSDYRQLNSITFEAWDKSLKGAYSRNLPTIRENKKKNVK